MMATAKPPRSAEADATAPQAAPAVAPNYGIQDHSFTLQAIMELQRSLGELNANVVALKSSIDGVKNKVDDLVSWKHKIIGGVAVAGAVIAILTFAITKAADYVTFKSPTQPQATAPAQPVPPAVPGKK